MDLRAFLSMMHANGLFKAFQMLTLKKERGGVELYPEHIILNLTYSNCLLAGTIFIDYEIIEWSWLQSILNMQGWREALEHRNSTDEQVETSVYMMNSWDTKQQGFHPTSREKSMAINNGRKAAAAVRCSLLAGGKCHLWTRISKNPKCCNSGEGSVLGGMGPLGLLGNNAVLICGVC